MARPRAAASAYRRREGPFPAKRHSIGGSDARAVCLSPNALHLLGRGPLNARPADSQAAAKVRVLGQEP